MVIVLLRNRVQYGIERIRGGDEILSGTTKSVRHMERSQGGRHSRS